MKLDRRLHRDIIKTTDGGPTTCKAFNNPNDLLTPIELSLILVGSVLAKTTVGLPRKSKDGKTQLTIISKPKDQIDITRQFEWVDERALFDSNTHYIQQL